MSVTALTPRLVEVTVPAAQLKDALTAGVAFASTDSRLPGLNAIHLTVSEGVVTVESTDRYRLVQAQITAEEQHADWGALLPLDAAKAVLRMISRASGTASLSVGMGDITFQFGDGAAATHRTVMGQEFPRLGGLLERHTPEPVAEAVMNPKFLASVGKLPFEKEQLIRWEFGGKGRAVRAQWVAREVRYAVLIMPGKNPT